MRCLMCGKELGKGSFRDILIGEDPLCTDCRKQWMKRPLVTKLDGIRMDADYEYDAVFSKCLIQYKECGDEALKNVFLYEVKKKLRRRYRGYTLLLMPSSMKKYQERGFSHLRRMYSCLGLPMMEPFIKKDERTQKEMNREERRKMVHDIILDPAYAVPEKIVLCDDTVTSGSTLRGALSCLDRNRHEIRIYCVSANASWYDR